MTAIVSQRARIAPIRKPRYSRMMRPGSADALILGRLEDRHADQRREDHRDEPGHDQRDADHGEDREGVLAGGALAKPIGTKPAIVTSVPVSIGAASVR